MGVELADVELADVEGSSLAQEQKMIDISSVAIMNPLFMIVTSLVAGNQMMITQMRKNLLLTFVAQYRMVANLT